MKNRNRWLISGLFLLMSLCGFSQQKAGTVDIFMGVDFNYRDIFGITGYMMYLSTSHRESNGIWGIGGKPQL